MRIYFASDIHASEKCWLKFLNTPKFYKADVIIIGGDITGKFIVPIIKQPNGKWTATLHGVQREAASREEVDRLARQIADSGSYSFETTPEEYATYKDDQERIDALFKRLVIERAERWMELAANKLRGSGVRCFVSGANDDFFEVDDVLLRADYVECPEGRVVDLDGGFQLASVGYGNPTPWNCPRDIPEPELADKIEAVARQVTRRERAIFNLHVPPYGTGLDLAPKLDPELRMVMGPSGEPEMIPVGSTAVLDAIQRWQPMLGLHGHIHESKGVKKLGSTTVVNPGSEYGEGILDGALIDLDPKKGLVRVQLVSG
jgi:Icc-related predicted phosphoesterase